MAKYVPKSFNGSRHWWKRLSAAQSKKMSREEHRAAIFYEFLAREHSQNGKPVYTLQVPWIELPKTFRVLASVVIFPGPTDVAFMEDEYATLGKPTQILRGMGRTWSKVYPIRFNLEISPRAVGLEMQKFISELQKQYARPIRRLEGRANRRMSYRPIELSDKQLRGDPLTTTPGVLKEDEVPQNRPPPHAPHARSSSNAN